MRQIPNCLRESKKSEIPKHIFYIEIDFSRYYSDIQRLYKSFNYDYNTLSAFLIFYSFLRKFTQNFGAGSSAS